MCTVRFKLQNRECCALLFYRELTVWKVVWWRTDRRLACFLRLTKRQTWERVERLVERSIVCTLYTKRISIEQRFTSGRVVCNNYAILSYIRFADTLRGRYCDDAGRCLSLGTPCWFSYVLFREGKLVRVNLFVRSLLHSDDPELPQITATTASPSSHLATDKRGQI